MKNCPIFISSSDSYSDLWPHFFELFKKYWPEYDGIIYLNTENKLYSDDKLNIICTQVGTQGSFGKTFRAGLDKVKEKHLLFIMIDYFFMGKVDNQLFLDYYEYFIKNDLDSICFKKHHNPIYKSLNYKDLNLLIPPTEAMFNYQIGLWKKNTLYEMALPHESPWISEFYGMKRANVMKIKLAYDSEDKTFQYLASGALQKGKWVHPMIEFFEKMEYNIDFSKRGLSEKIPHNLKSRATGRIQTFIPRLLSNLDLLKRKYLQYWF